MASKFDFGSNFLYAEDFLKQQKFVTAKLTIAEVHLPGTMKCCEGKKTVKSAVLAFEKTDKLLVLNKTNRSILHLLTGYGPDKSASTLEDAWAPCRNWIGFQVTLQARVVRWGKGEVLGVRIIPPVGMKVQKGISDHLGVAAVFEGEKRMKELSHPENIDDDHEENVNDTPPPEDM